MFLLQRQVFLQHMAWNYASTPWNFVPDVPFVSLSPCYRLLRGRLRSRVASTISEKIRLRENRRSFGRLMKGRRKGDGGERRKRLLEKSIGEGKVFWGWRKACEVLWEGTNRWLKLWGLGWEIVEVFCSGEDIEMGNQTVRIVGIFFFKIFSFYFIRDIEMINKLFCGQKKKISCNQIFF